MNTISNATLNVLRETRAAMATASADIKPALANAWANVAAPVAIVTMRDAQGKCHATTVTAFTSISFDPPVLMIALAHASSFLARVDEDSRIALSVLESGQQHVVAACAVKSEDRLRDVITIDEGFGPVVSDASACFGCTINRMVDAGDHKLVFADIETVSSAQESHGLLYWQRRFGFSTPVNA
ncbi:NADH-FMN oxidoreductase [Candidatus Burkholderia verschuerenii]|uniref:NADH-FMN oxidoreductase n=1 Tax=Candidatus Burkholderia verschuerenii TaxID=242163 RepID=A0A0L0M6I3_9BURK|nr:flavin reductase family protein [Candidatus Burkholderia verschuerenii]KND58262.1 NADH-FMN oxidoreductase [Candidatus Burkholderia verschuerenii]